MERREEEGGGKTAADAAFSTKRNCQHRRFVEAIAGAELPLSGKEAHPVPRFPASLLPASAFICGSWEGGRAEMTGCSAAPAQALVTTLSVIQRV